MENNDLQNLSKAERKKFLRQQKKQEKAQIRAAHKRSRTMKVVLFAVIAIVIVGGITAFGINQASKPGKYDEFVSCLLEADAKMYGAYWCPHCADQKTTLTKKSFDKFEDAGGYVECDPRGKNADPQACQLVNVRSYPTWIVGEQRAEGAQTITQLAELTGCQA